MDHGSWIMAQKNKNNDFLEGRNKCKHDNNIQNNIMKISPHAVSTLLVLAWVEFRLSGHTKSKAVETPGSKEGNILSPEDFHKLETKVEEIAQLQNRRLDDSDSLFECEERNARRVCSPINPDTYFNFQQGIVIGVWNSKCNYGASIFSVAGPSNAYTYN